ncbi:MAG: efflux RND transporter periplasmic adaptor subunit, partial [Bacteroidia bacterium]
MNQRMVTRLGTVVALCWVLLQGCSEKVAETMYQKPQEGKFEVLVTTTGEMQAQNSVDISGPTGARKAGIYQLKITQLVAEGTVVAQGDFVAELDKSEIVGKLKEVEINLQKFQSVVTQAKLDCTLTLAQARDEMVNLKYAMEQRKLEKEESTFESPSTKRQAEIEYEKSIRGYNQAQANYETKVKQATAKMREAEADLFKEQQKLEDYQGILGEFTILAPEKGMLIYAREWDGKKRVVGSTVSPWDPTVATLPDLTQMESITYVNEVDIQKIKVGQEVRVSLDASPDKKLTGKVTHVANVGEQRPNSDSKVFEVKIAINEKDSTLRPAMTTSNEIIT